MYSLIGTAKLNNIDPQARLADVLARIADIPQHRLAELLPWNWKPDPSTMVLAQAVDQRPRRDPAHSARK